MTVESDIDRLALLEDWGQSATLPAGTQIQGIFDDKYLGIDANGMVVEADSPIFVCRESDVASLSNGDSITIGTTAYIVRTIKPDGSGMAQLVLSDG